MSNTRTPFTTVMATQLARARKGARLSQGDLASKIGVARAQVKRMECAEVGTVDIDVLRKAEKVLKLSFRIKTRERPTKDRREKSTSLQSSPEVESRALEVKRGAILRMIRTMMGSEVAKLVKRHGLGGVTLNEILAQK